MIIYIPHVLGGLPISCLTCQPQLNNNGESLSGFKGKCRDGDSSNWNDVAEIPEDSSDNLKSTTTGGRGHATCWTALMLNFKKHTKVVGHTRPVPVFVVGRILMVNPILETVI